MPKTKRTMLNFILKNENAIYNECGYSCDNAIFLKLKDKSFFITDPRYTIEAGQNVKNAEVIEAKRSIIKQARILIRSIGAKKIIFDPNDFSIACMNELTTSLNVVFSPKKHFSQQSRIVKSKTQIELLRQAAKFGEMKFKEFAKFINENGIGMSEKELNFHAQNIFRDNGNLELSFSPIVAINKNAAKAHALPTDTKLKDGDLLLVDAGVKYARYCSDRTRTAFIRDGFEFCKEQKFKNTKIDEVYNIVKEAQIQAIRAVAPGVLACEIDSAARNFISKFGYRNNFSHSTGHGVGIDIHELPIISQNSKTPLKEGMVFSIEPGIYIENEFGVRIEDVVVVTSGGCEIL